MKHALLILALLIASNPSQAEELSQHERIDTNTAKLNQIRSNIKTLRDELSHTQTLQTDANKKLEQVVKQISRQARLVSEIDKKISLHKKQLSSLNQQKKGLTKSLSSQQKNLAQQIRSKYALGRQEYVKLLLNQQNPASVSRVLTYYDYLNDAHINNIKSIKKDLKQLQRVTKNISNNETQLKQSHENRVNDLKSLQQSRRQRQTIVAKLNKEIKTTGSKLKHFLADEKRLLELLGTLAKQRQQPMMESVSYEAFNSLKGKLPWPTSGKIIARYGSKRSGSNLRWKGILIKASQGKDITAISHGRVVYADWLRGFGLLMILDHGDGYMSLYGHNESLYKELGQWVEPSEVIAKVGSSGGYPDSGLYFEIRHNGKPTNPAKWCKK